MSKDVDRRGFLRIMGTGIAAAAFSPRSLGASNVSRRRPNILFILADDLGWHQIQCYGSRFYETPNIDRLAAEGIRFTEAYAACPVCSPTRASIMTGKYPARLHLTDYIPGNPYPEAKLKTPDWTKYLPLEEMTIPEALKPAGYVSGHFGKWHLNKDKNYEPGRPMDPASQGFDEVFTTVKPKPDADPTADPHHVKAITDRAIAFIETNVNKPFFCYVTHNSIHTPVMERPELVAKYAAKLESNDEENRAVMGAMVENLDRRVGRILDRLDELGVADNTIVVFFSDNGALHGRERLKPLRGGKADLYEGGIRVPLIVRWPGVVRPGSECTEPVSSIDFYPTFLDITGQPVTDRTIDGESLLSLLKQTGPLKRDAIYWHYPHYHSSGIAPSGAIRQGSYKLIEWFESSVDGLHAGGAIELFNLKQNIGEQHNLAKEMPGKAAELYARLKAWRTSVNAQEMRKNPDYDPTNTAQKNRVAQ